MLPFRLGITGLPGAGKTSLSWRLAPRICAENDKHEIALIHGDSVLPQNIVSICSVLDRFIVEHICLAQICEKSDVKFIDRLIFLDISPEECQMRCNNRKQHEVGVESFEELYEEIYFSIDRLAKAQGILLCRIDQRQQEYILQYDVKGIELVRYLFPGGFIDCDYP